MEHQTTKPKKILKILQITQITAWMNSKTNVSTKRLNSRVEFHGKIYQPGKKLDKLTIYFCLNRILWAFQW